jgi:hypothetical protein
MMESDTVISLFRRGRISQAQLDRQLDEIEREEKALRLQLDQSAGCKAAPAVLPEPPLETGSLRPALERPESAAYDRTFEWTMGWVPDWTLHCPLSCGWNGASCRQESL